MLVRANKGTSPGKFALGIDVIILQVTPDTKVRKKAKLSTIGHLLVAFVSAAIKVGEYPQTLKEAWVTAIPKDKADPSKVRPISVMPELLKIISRTISGRIRRALVAHPQILAKAQRAGIADGDFYQATDVILDVIEDYIANKHAWENGDRTSPPL